MLKKIEYTKQNLNNNIIKNILICPICNNKITLQNNSLICKNKHCFDITKKGYFTLIKKNKLRNETIYDTNLYINRINFINNNFYDELHKLISKIINTKNNSQLIVDMGCGDGTHDNKILNLINNKETHIIGIDISKNGIELSSNYVNNNFIPIIADLNYLPINNKSTDIILNILSPSNEQEMKRILKEDGIIIKVTPKKEYLQELRKILNIKEYKNEQVIENNIKKNYTIIDKYTINETKKLNTKTLNNLINMTPLTKHYESHNININQITIALNIYVLKVRDSNE